MMINNLLEHQKQSFERFLQENVPLKERKMCGIHKELVRAFGLKDHFNVYIKEVPPPKIVEYLRELSGTSTIDVIASIKANYPILTLLDRETLEEVERCLKKENVLFTIEPSGLIVNNNKYKAIVQYCDYRIERDDEMDSAKEKYLKTRLRSYGSYLGETPLSSPKKADRTLKVDLFVKFRVSVYKEDEKVRETEEEMWFADIPVPTETFSFIINGVERFVISVRQRPIGILFLEDDSSFKPFKQYECFIESEGVFNHRIIRLKQFKDGIYILFSESRRVPVTDFFRTFDIDITDERFRSLFFDIRESSVEEVLKNENISKLMLVQEKGDICSWREVPKEALKGLSPQERIEYITSSNNSLLWSLVNTSHSIEESFIRVLKTLEGSDMIIREKSYAFSRLYYWLSSFELGSFGRLVVNRKLEPVFEEIGEKPSEKHTNLTLLDVIAATKYFIHLNERRPFKNGEMPTEDDPFHLGNTRILTICELLEDALREGLIASINQTREKILRELREFKS